MLDDQNVLEQRDPSGALRAAMNTPEQLRFEPEIIGDMSSGSVDSVILAGMGGSALAAEIVKVLVAEQMEVPLEIIKDYDLPKFASESTLVIAISHSGNTEETLSCYEQAKGRGCQLAVVATGGKLIELAESDNVTRAIVPGGAQPRMSTGYHLRTLLGLLNHFMLIDPSLYSRVADSADWLSEQMTVWAPGVPLGQNYAKQLAEQAAGKIGVFYGGPETAPLAYKWKISWNETAKNLGFWNQYPEFSHNEFMGWTSHPVDKPFAVFDLRSSLERPRIRERMELTDRMLSGMRPKAVDIELGGETLVQKMLWGMALAEMASIYLAILNNVDPTPVALIEKFKQELP